MEKITLTFHLFENRKMDYQQVLSLRKEVLNRLDNALKQVNAGKWVGSLYTTSVIEIYLMVNDYEKALSIIQTTLKGHWLLPLLKVARQSKQSAFGMVSLSQGNA